MPQLYIPKTKDGIGSIGIPNNFELIIKDVDDNLSTTEILLHCLGNERIVELLNMQFSYSMGITCTALREIEAYLNKLPREIHDVMEDLTDCTDVAISIDWMSMELFSRVIALKKLLLEEIRRVNPALLHLTMPSIKWVKITTQSTWYAITLTRCNYHEFIEHTY